MCCTLNTSCALTHLILTTALSSSIIILTHLTDGDTETKERKSQTTKHVREPMLLGIKIYLSLPPIHSQLYIVQEKFFDLNEPPTLSLIFPLNTLTERILAFISMPKK